MSVSSKTSTLREFANSKTASNTSYQTFSLIEIIGDEELSIQT